MHVETQLVLQDNLYRTRSSYKIQDIGINIATGVRIRVSENPRDHFCPCGHQKDAVWGHLCKMLRVYGTLACPAAPAQRLNRAAGYFVVQHTDSCED